MVDLTKKPFYLNEEQIAWVENTIAGMTEEEKIKQLFIHLTGAVDDEEAVKEECATMQMGGIRFNPRSKEEEMWNMNRLFQTYSKIPVLSAVNVEAGGNGASSDGTNVGQEIKVAATGDKEYAYKMGQICGRETRATGSNWAFAPIVDLTMNWHNPAISTRAFGKDPDMVLVFAKEYFRGISESGIVCAMKHFPGDGVDERDPHIATSVNSLSCEEWDNTFGKVYRGMIEAGVQSLMPGHIMMPAYQKKFNPACRDEDLLPATLSKELLTDLLRGQLGFNGLIVTDASHMVGLAGRAKRSDLVPQSIMAGCDIFLFYNDFEEDIGYTSGLSPALWLCPNVCETNAATGFASWYVLIHDAIGYAWSSQSLTMKIGIFALARQAAGFHVSNHFCCISGECFSSGLTVRVSPPSLR